MEKRTDEASCAVEPDEKRPALVHMSALEFIRDLALADAHPARRMPSSDIGVE